MRMHVKIRAQFLNGMRIERTFPDCADIPDALAQFDRLARDPINLGQYNVTGLHFGFNSAVPAEEGHARNL